MSDREKLATELAKHKYDTVSQDSGMQCICGSDSRFAQRDGDGKWGAFPEHLADMALRALKPEDPATANMRRLVEADRRENVCRCPILRVGDYCPVHGG